MYQLDDVIDLVIPRGSNRLVSQIKESTKIPVLGHSGEEQYKSLLLCICLLCLSLVFLRILPSEGKKKTYLTYSAHDFSC